MTKIDYRNIERDPARCGGQAVVANTRIRVAIILGASRAGMSVEEIVENFPPLRTADVYDALAYAEDHSEEIEKDILGDQEAIAKDALLRRNTA